MAKSDCAALLVSSFVFIGMLNETLFPNISTNSLTWRFSRVFSDSD